MIFGGLFDLENKLKRKKELDNIINDISFWTSDNRENILKESNFLNDVISKVMDIKNKLDSDMELLLMELDNEMMDLINSEYEELKVKVEKLRIDTYLSGEFDKNDCLLEIHSGAGGTEACDWANMLYRMYTRYLLKSGYKIEEMDKQDGEEVGIKSVMIRVNGRNAYGYLKHEKGVHRLVRISPFDANKRRHTSFASVEIIPQMDENIDIQIQEKDLRVDIYRSSGPGGQGVNTTDSAVRVTHIPTGIVVTCQNERSQIQNKEHCMEILRSKLYQLEMEKKNKTLSDMKNGQMSIAFGSGKRSYVMCPYTLVKDSESGYETSSVEKVLDGELDEFIKTGLRV